MSNAPDLNEYIQHSPHSLEGVEQFHQNMVEHVKRATGDRLGTTDVKPIMLQHPIPFEFHNVHEKEVLAKEAIVETQNLEGAKVNVTESSNPLGVLLNKLGKKGQIIEVK